MKLFYTYHIKEFLFYTFIIFFLVLLFVGTIRATLAFAELTQFDLSLSNILLIFFTSFGEISAFSLLFASYLSVLFVVQRMKYEREILGFFSLGYSLKDFLKTIFLFSFFAFLFLLFLTIGVVPKSKRMQKELKINLFKSMIESKIPERSPFPIGKETFLYVKKTIENSTVRLYDVFLLEESHDKRGIYRAKSGIFDQKNGKLSLEDGSAFFLDQKGRLEIIKFKYYEVSLKVEELKKEDYYIKRGEMSLKELKYYIQKESDKKKIYRYMAELYGRFFFPLTSFLLLIQAFFLGLIIHAPQRTLLFIIGSLFYFLFFGFYNFCTSLSEAGKFHPLVGFIFFFVGTSLIIGISYGYIIRKGIAYL